MHRLALNSKFLVKYKGRGSAWNRQKEPVLMGMIWTNHACLYYEHASVVVFGLVYNAQVEGMEICIPPASAIILQWFK